MRIIFILKDRFYNNVRSDSYGLMNSARQVAEFLETLGHECKVVQVVDGNSIDREVYNYKPDMVVIEALWVTSEKLKELIEIKRYRNIQWVVRVHSNIGFLSAETFALKYVNDYIDLKKENLYISFNNKEFNNYISKTLNYNFLYLPNIITIHDHHKKYLDFKEETDEIIEQEKLENNFMDVGCFGSLRIMKNQCYQAMCAMEAADKLEKELRFHITLDVGTEETESNKYPVLKNLEELFKNSHHRLIKHFWMSNDEFQHLVKQMDIGLQISYSESFNIVAADFVKNHVPIVGSDAITWLPDQLKTSTVDFEETIEKIIYIYEKRHKKWIRRQSIRNLLEYNKHAKLEWISFVGLDWLCFIKDYDKI